MAREAATWGVVVCEDLHSWGDYAMYNAIWQLKQYRTSDIQGSLIESSCASYLDPYVVPSLKLLLSWQVWLKLHSKSASGVVIGSWSILSFV